MFSINEKATQESAKQHNQRLVLKTIYDQGPISRVDVARATHLARTTVSNVVAMLMSEGWVEEVGQRVPERGKPPTLLCVNKHARHLIGVDLAGSDLYGTVNDLRGKVLHRRYVPLGNLNGKHAQERVFRLIDELASDATSPILGIGVGVPGIVDVKRGVVRQSDRLNWREVPLQQILEERYQLPVYIANDSHLAAFGEYSFGNGRDVSSLVLITVGAGVSAGIVLNGRPYFGDAFAAGEIGHITVNKEEDALLCSCGHRGCLETLVNEKALIHQAQAIARRHPSSKLHQFVASPEHIVTIEPVLEAFQDGDEALHELIIQVGKRLGQVTAYIASILNVERVLISGYIARFGAPLISAMIEECRASVHPILASHIQILPSALGQDIVNKGAVAMVLSSEVELL